MPAKYSLEALRTLRAAREEARGRELCERAADLQRASEATQSAAHELASTRRGRSEARSAEQEQLQDGAVLASQLSLGAEYDRGRALCEEQQRGELERAESAERAARSGRDSAVSALAQAHAEREAVERHREAFLRKLEQKAQDAEDDSALERWNAVRFEGGGQGTP